jgi:Tol biopolymer transport system component
MAGVGGMGEVYRAHDRRLGREVAIKLLPETLALDASRLRRFEQEARAAGSPNGNVIIYNGPIVEGLASVRAITPEGQPRRLPEVEVRPGGQRFLPDGSGVVYQSNVMNFHVLDLATGATRQLTRHDLNAPQMTGQTFDVSPDGSQIVFDRSKENSDVVLIELPR